MGALVLEGVHASYGRSHILHGVTLHVDPGEVVCLLGRNGAGKTTTLLTVMGYLHPDRGAITYDGRSIVALPPYQVARRGFGFVPQERGIFPSLTVRENLMVAARRRGRWRLDDIFRLFPRIADRQRNLGFQLSGGEQQMLSIARALLLDPQVLLLDEPSEGLAPLMVEEVLQILRGLREEGFGVLLVEQNLHVALAVADRLYVMVKGEIRFAGNSTALREDDRVMTEYLGV